MSDPSDWKIFHGDSRAADGSIDGLPPPPPWRDLKQQFEHRGATYQATPYEIQMVNAALYLRRPLLVTGPPGSGKSSLAYAVARELGLGSVLKWPLNSRSTLAQGLYEYDAMARLRDLQEQAHHAQSQPVPAPISADHWKRIGDYIRLGPLGTALYSPDPKARPRALLIDEIDKSDVDFPNDLLNILEEGEFEIPELARIAARAADVDVLPCQGDNESPDGVVPSVQPRKRSIHDGKVKCTVFPFIVITNNRERELPPAFLRRCLRLDVKTPQEADLRRIINAHFGSENAPAREHHVRELLERFEGITNSGRDIAVDQLLNALFLMTREHAPTDQDRKELLTVVMRALDEA
jgi:MoxR-like ATPase